MVTLFTVFAASKASIDQNDRSFGGDVACRPAASATAGISLKLAADVGALPGSTSPSAWRAVIDGDAHM